MLFLAVFPVLFFLASVGIYSLVVTEGRTEPTS